MSNEYYATEFVDGLREQERGIWESLGRPYIRKQEKRIDKAAASLKETEEGVRVFAGLLSHPSPAVALTAVVFLMDTSAEMQAVETLRRYAKGPEEDFDSACARQGLKEWEKRSTEKRHVSTEGAPDTPSGDRNRGADTVVNMTVEEFRTAIRAAGLSRHESGLLALCRNSISVTCKGGQGELEPGASKLGGLPDLPAEARWPIWNGAPLSFIGQFRMSDVAEYDTDSLLPPTGMMYFFYDADQDAWGYARPNKGRWKVMYWDAEAPGTAPRPAPATLPAEALFGECGITFTRESSFPPWESYDVHKLGMTEKEMSAYQDILLPIAEYREQHPTHRLLGHPDIVQSDMQLECQLVTHGLYCGDESGYNDPRVASLESGAADWRLLLQVDSQEEIGMMWGDAGRLYFWITDNDLADRCFDRVWVVLQCG